MTPGYRAKLNYLQIVMLQCYNLQIVLAIGLPLHGGDRGRAIWLLLLHFFHRPSLILLPPSPAQPSPAQPSPAQPSPALQSSVLTAAILLPVCRAFLPRLPRTHARYHGTCCARARKFSRELSNYPRGVKSRASNPRNALHWNITPHMTMVEHVR